MFGPKIGIAVVPTEHIEVRRLATSGCRSLETCRLTIDGVIPDGLLLVQEGLGLHAVNWGLTCERMAGAAQALGGAETAIWLTTTHLHRRHQFGVALYEHQALRLRLASLAAEVMLACNGLYVLASNVKPNQLFMRQAAGAKVTAALLAERVLSECAHMFGGPGFLEDETLFPRVIADLRLARLGGGSNEVMWELFAQSLETDGDLYQRLTSIEAPPEPDQAV